jgi:hypothetical protein
LVSDEQLGIATDSELRVLKATEEFWAVSATDRLTGGSTEVWTP